MDEQNIRPVPRKESEMTQAAFMDAVPTTEMTGGIPALLPLEQQEQLMEEMFRSSHLDD